MALHGIVVVPIPTSSCVSKRKEGSFPKHFLGRARERNLLRKDVDVRAWLEHCLGLRLLGTLRGCSGLQHV